MEQKNSENLARSCCWGVPFSINKGNVLNRDKNLAEKETASEVLFLLEKLANAKGPVSEALNEATKEYAKKPTKDTLSKVTSGLLKN